MVKGKMSGRSGRCVLIGLEYLGHKLCSVGTRRGEEERRGEKRRGEERRDEMG